MNNNYDKHCNNDAKIRLAFYIDLNLGPDENSNSIDDPEEENQV